MASVELIFKQEAYLYEGTYAEGYLFDKEKRYYRDRDLLDYFAQAKSWEAFKRLCRKANGAFRVVITYEGECWIATDHRASYHLYYYQSPLDQKLYVAGNGFACLEHIHEPSWRKASLAFFLNKGCTPQNYTLLEGLYSLAPATAVRLSEEGKLLSEPYEALVASGNAPKETEAEALTKFKHLLDEATERLIQHLNGRQVVLSLTGGFDSRLIACQLKCYNYPKVLCLAYGKSGNEDMLKAKLVAKRLGYPFHYVPSVDTSKLSDYREDKAFLDYLYAMTGLSASYFFQEFMPSQTLMDCEFVEQGAVVLTGHQGDGIGGSQIMDRFFLKEKDLSLEELADKLFKHKQKHQAFTAQAEQIIKQEIKSSLQMLEATSPNASAMNIFEGFISNEDYPKYILNSQHSWRYRGFETATLFTDKALYRFAYSLPVHLRFGKKLYDKLAQQIFQDYDLNFDDDELLLDILNSPSYRLKQWLKPFLQPFLPKSQIFSQDLIGFDDIMRPLQREVKADKRFAPQSINGLSFSWYLKHLEQKLKLPLPSDLF